MYAIVYVGEPKEMDTPEGTKLLQEGMLLGCTEYPEEFRDKTDIQLVEVQNYDMEPLKWKYENGTWMEVGNA